MSLNQAILDSRAEASAKAGRELAAKLREHGIPERHDLGALQNLRARFSEMSGAEFDRVIQTVRGRGSKT